MFHIRMGTKTTGAHPDCKFTAKDGRYVGMMQTGNIKRYDTEPFLDAGVEDPTRYL